MAESFAIHPERLANSGRSLLALGQDLDAHGLSGSVASDDSAWGCDAAGAAFQLAYAELIDVTSRALTTLETAVEDTGTALEDTATDTLERDQANADDLRRILDGLT